MMTEAILQDLHSKLHAEHRYLTTKAIAIEHSLPRQTAISILGSLPYFDTGKEYTYEITRCIMDKIDGKYGKYHYCFASLCVSPTNCHLGQFVLLLSCKAQNKPGNNPARDQKIRHRTPDLLDFAKK